MALFGIGGSKSRSSSQSTSLDYGFQESFSDSLSRAVSEAQSGGSSFSTQNIANADVLQQLYGGALGAMPDASLFQGQAAELYGAGGSILDRLGVGEGEDYLSARLTDTTARDAQLGALQSGLGNLFRDELNPAITSRAVGGGALGGGRQGVAQGQAMRSVADMFQQGASSILASDQAQRDAAAGSLMAGRTQAAATGLQGLQTQLGIAQAGLDAPLSQYSALAGILGGPTVLTESGSEDFSTATSESVAEAISRALGMNYGTSQSTSKSKSGSFNFGFGGG